MWGLGHDGPPTHSVSATLLGMLGPQVGGPLQPERYRVSDDVEFAVDIFLCEDGACQPYK